MNINETVKLLQRKVSLQQKLIIISISSSILGLGLAILALTK